MAGFLVTQNFTRNGAANKFVMYVGSPFAASAVAATNLATTIAQNQISAKANQDIIVFGASSSVATSA